MNYKLDFSTAYHQFYICDMETDQDTANPQFWTEAASQDRLAIGNGILGVGLECYGPFKGELIVLEVPKIQIDYDQYDHIVEGGLIVNSGILQVLDCPNSHVELEIIVSPGIYRVRVYSQNLASVIGDSGNDYYKVGLWPDENVERRVLKRYLPSPIE